MKKFTLVIRGEKNEEAFEAFREFTVKKYQSSKFLSNAIMSLIRHNVTYPDKIHSTHTQQNDVCNFKGKNPEEVYKDMVDALHQSDGYHLHTTALKTLIRRKFGIIDDRTVRNWINKLVSDKYISLGDGKDANRYIIRLNKLGVNEEEEEQKEKEINKEEPAELTEEEKGILYE